LSETVERRPRTFKDAAGREWTLKITVGDLKPVREATGVKIAELPNDNLKPFGELLKDPEKFCAVIWCLIRDDAARLDVTEAGFFKSLGGDSAEHAAHALYEAVADFCPSQTRSLLTRMARKNQELDAAFTAIKLDAIDGLTLDSLRRPTPNGPPGAGPASSESTPAATPSANSTG